MMGAIAGSGGAMAAASERTHEYFRSARHRLPRERGAEAPLAAAPDSRGRDKMCFAVTEPDAGLDTTRIATRGRPRRHGIMSCAARRSGPRTAQVSDKIIAARPHRAAPRPDAPTEGTQPLLHRSRPRHGAGPGRSRRWAARRSDSNEIWFDGIAGSPETDRIGEEGKGFRPPAPRASTRSVSSSPRKPWAIGHDRRPEGGALRRRNASSSVGPHRGEPGDPSIRWPRRGPALESGRIWRP